MTLAVADRLALADLVHLYAAAVDDRRFGSISTTGGENRTLQLGIKVYFDSGH